MKSSKVLSVRIPKVELAELEARAQAAGLPVGTYVRTLLHRERVDSAAAIALLHKLVETQHVEMLAALAEQQGQSRAALDAAVRAGDRIDRLKEALLRFTGEKGAPR